MRQLRGTEPRRDPKNHAQAHIPTMGIFSLGGQSALWSGHNTSTEGAGQTSQTTFPLIQKLHNAACNAG